ncbi:hypothetical protein D3261_04550 [Halococcus sp. IIIV-5B]|nr:hypothetical protein D3261_04550 [Halococcus sp. IIIV-5B]
MVGERPAGVIGRDGPPTGSSVHSDAMEYRDGCPVGNRALDSWSYDPLVIFGYKASVDPLRLAHRFRGKWELGHDVRPVPSPPSMAHKT